MDNGIGGMSANVPGNADHDALGDYAAYVGTVIGGLYRVDRLIAEGGMATVYLAEDLRHGRMVAVKVLHESLAHSIGVQRFLREIEVVARLQHPHLLTLIDSGTVNELPYFVMPYLESQSLRETIAQRGKLALTDAITITREIADGLAYAHERGVVHRDIKPSNILMSDGHAVVADFGIATAIRKSSGGRITVTGSSLGSPTYMSPEQAAGELDIDVRSDVYSLACVLYEMLTGQPPFDAQSMQQMLTHKLTGGYAKLRARRPELPVALEAVLHRALAPERSERFASVHEFSQAMSAALPVAKGLSKRTQWTLAAAALVMVAGGAAVVQHQRRLVWAQQQIVEIDRLAKRGSFLAAFQLDKQVRPLLPNDSTLNALRPLFTDYLKVITVPVGARVSIRRLAGSDTSWTTVGVTPMDSLWMPKFISEVGYRMRIERDGYETVDVHANLFTDMRWIGGGLPIDTMFLDRKGAPTAGMAHIRGRRLVEGRDTVRVADYHIGKREVSNREYARFVAAGGYEEREYWTEPMVRDGKALTWEQGIAELRDKTGKPGPSTWNNGTFPPGQDDFPVGGVSWFEAAAYARFTGMQLPTSQHWRNAAFRGAREAGWMYTPTSNLNGTGARLTGLGMMSVYGLYDVAGNVREWTVNPADPGRLTQGGSWEDSPFQVGHLIGRPAFDRSPLNGFRVAYITDSASIVARLSTPILRNVNPRDFRNFVAVSDAEFAGFRRMYDYDKRPLEARLEGEGELPDARWQKVSFTAAYNGPRMVALLLYPKTSNGPFEPVILWGASNALTDRRLNPQDGFVELFASFVPRSGRMLVVPLYMGTYERRDSTFGRPRGGVPDSTTGFRDLTVTWIKDLRRTIDFLETRQDVRADRVGFYGVSWGGLVAPLALSMEPRIKAAVLYSAGYASGPNQQARTEVLVANYAPRVRTPTLMLSGIYDAVFAYETSAVPFFDQLGTPSPDKKLIANDGGHALGPDVGKREALAWFDQYLSGRAPAPPRQP